MTEDEFLNLYRQYGPRIWRYCAFRTGSRTDAEDFAAETFARLLARGDEVRPERRGAWLLAVARNLCTDHERHARRERPPVGRAEGEASDAEPVWADEGLRKALAGLKPAQQQVVFLRAVEDLSFAEIGRLVGRSEGAVRVQYHRAVRQVRKAMEKVTSCSQPSTETP